MRRELPNLDWLRVFAVTANTQSFALAADELLVTPGAVSQRIKSLEAFLGLSLFRRYPQGVELTESGRRYAQRVLPALEQLTEATREIALKNNARVVRVTVLPALAQLWLGPRMDHFHALHPNISIEIWADPTVVDMRTSPFDVALRYGRPPFPGCEHRALFFDELVPMASPGLIESSPLDSRGLPEATPLMLDSYWAGDFDQWLSETGHARGSDPKTQVFSLYSMAVDAALQGRGFIIGHTSLLSELLQRGELHLLSGQRVPTRNQFHLLTKSVTPLSEAASAFVEWLEQEAEIDVQIDALPISVGRTTRPVKPDGA